MQILCNLVSTLLKKDQEATKKHTHMVSKCFNEEKQPY